MDSGVPILQFILIDLSLANHANDTVDNLVNMKKRLDTAIIIADFQEFLSKTNQYGELDYEILSKVKYLPVYELKKPFLEYSKIIEADSPNTIIETLLLNQKT